jgi:hypothetical protein
MEGESGLRAIRRSLTLGLLGRDNVVRQAEVDNSRDDNHGSQDEHVTVHGRSGLESRDQCTEENGRRHKNGGRAGFLPGRRMTRLRVADQGMTVKVLKVFAVVFPFQSWKVTMA